MEGEHEHNRPGHSAPDLVVHWMTVEHASSSLQELRIVQLVPHWENLAAPLAYHNLVSGRGKFCVWIAITHGRMATASMVYSNQGAQCIGPSNAFFWDGAISEIRPLGAIYTRRALSLAAKYLPVSYTHLTLPTKA